MRKSKRNSVSSETALSVGRAAVAAGRRPASYEIVDIRNNTRRSEPLGRVNEILAAASMRGVRRRYLPDFLIRLASGKTLVLEIKGEDSEQNRARRAALDAWVQAVNVKGGFGFWCWDVAFESAQIQDILARH
jgi:hypothetical protein